MTEVRASSATAYPQLYKGTYWGCFDININNEITPTIIENRNCFAKDFELISNIGDMYKNHEKETLLINEMSGERVRDHVEYYSAKNKRAVAVFSTYDRSEKLTDLAVRSGYNLIYPIYSKSANTFVKVIERTK